MLEITDQVQFQLLFQSRMGFGNTDNKNGPLYKTLAGIDINRKWPKIIGKL